MVLDVKENSISYPWPTDRCVHRSSDKISMPSTSVVSVVHVGYVLNERV